MNRNVEFRRQIGTSGKWVVLAKPGYELLAEYIAHDLPQTRWGSRLLLSDIAAFEAGNEECIEEHSNVFTANVFRDRVELEHWYKPNASPLILSLDEFKDAIRRCLEFLEGGTGD